MPSSRPHGNFVMSFFETVKCTLKVRIYHYASDKSCADFSLNMHQKRLAASLRPDPLGGTYSAPLDLLSGLRPGTGTREGGRGNDRRGQTAQGGKQRKQGKGGREKGTEKSGRRMDAEILQGHPTAIPGNAKCVTKILGGQK